MPRPNYPRCGADNKRYGNKQNRKALYEAVIIDHAHTAICILDAADSVSLPLRQMAFNWLCRQFEYAPPNWNIGDHWKPAKSRMVITLATGPNRLTVLVDPDRPDVWRKDPYFSDIKN